MANQIIAKNSEFTALKRFRVDELHFDADGALIIPVMFFTRGSWNISGTFSPGGKVEISFTNDTAKSPKWSKAAVTLTEEGDFVEYYFGSFLKMKLEATDFEGVIYSSLDSKGV